MIFSKEYKIHVLQGLNELQENRKTIQWKEIFNKMRYLTKNKNELNRNSGTEIFNG